MNRHLKGFIASIVVIALCAFVTIATFAQGVWYGVFPLALGIFFLIKFAIPSWREYREETVVKKEDNPLLHPMPLNDSQRIRINRKDPTPSVRVFVNRLEEIISEYEKSNSIFCPPCKDEVLTEIRETMPKDFNYDDIEKQTRFVIMNTCARMLSTGQYHFHAASLNPVGETILQVYRRASQWLLDKGYLSKEDYDECATILRQNINEVG